MDLKKYLLSSLTFFLILTASLLGKQTDTLKIGIVGLSHSHVHGLLSRPDIGDLKIVGIAESDKALAERYAAWYGFSMDLVFDSIIEMIDKAKPAAVAGFGPIKQHLEIVEVCAPRGIHVMVEKPLAVSLEHAEKMRSLAEMHDIHLLTNYETTWYPSNQKLFEMVNNGIVGELRKIIVSDGHKGPKEIGVNVEFLSWLTDPEENGGGALSDFGCYGANLITWLKNGEKPISVTAVAQNFKPDIYNKVEDEATIILQYENMQGIIQASWNWPFSRKDIEIYGTDGYVIRENRQTISFKFVENEPETTEKLIELESPFNDPFSYFSAVINNEITQQFFSLSSIENNMVVMEILQAAKHSAETGKTIELFINK